MLIKFDTKANFWEMYPQFKVGFNEFYKQDKSKGKIESSSIMWAIALYVHPDSIYAPVNPTERLDIIVKDYLINNLEFDPVIYKKEFNLFKKLLMTKKERYLHEWEKKLDERDEFLSSVGYNEDTAEFLDKLMLNSKRLHEQYDKALEEFQKEKVDTTGKGGAEESLRERLKA